MLKMLAERDQLQQKKRYVSQARVVKCYTSSSSALASSIER